MRRLIILLFILTTFVFADLYQNIQSTQFKNGFHVILLPIPAKLESVSIQLWYKVGSGNEVSGNTGLSHMLEHYMFKGTKKYPKSAYSQLINKLGGRQNAYTAHDKTVYHVNIHSRHINSVLRLMADHMINLQFDDKVFMPERDVVLEERRMRIDNNPINSFMEKYNETLFGADSYAHPVIGYEADIRNYTTQKLQDYYNQYYQPRNATLIIVGNFNEKKVKKYIKKYFGCLKNKPDIPVLQKHSDVVLKTKFFKQRKGVQLPIVFFSRTTPGIGHPDYIYLELISKILFSGRSSIFQTEIADKYSTVIETSGYYHGDRLGPGMIMFYGICKNEQQIKKFESLLWKKISIIRKYGFRKKDLDKIKNRLKADHIYSLDSNYGLATQIGNLALLGKPYNYNNKLIEDIEKITPEQLKKKFIEYFQKDQFLKGYLLK